MQAGVRTFADQGEWMARYGHKGVMHRHISKPGDYTCLDGMGDLGVALPAGFICSTSGDLTAAYAALGVERVVLRPIRSTASPGEGCLRCSSSQELVYYDFPLGDVVLEEDLPLAAAEDGLLLLPRVPYLAGDRLGNTILDLCRVGDQVGGYRPSLLSEQEQKHVASVTAGFLGRVAPKGAGALSFGVTPDRDLVLLGVQMGTFVPEHILKMFIEQWAEDAAWFCWHHVPPRDLDIWTAWHRLTQHGIAFTPGVSTSGVFPLVYLRGTAGTFIAIADNDAEVYALRDLTSALLKEPLSTKPLTPANWEGEVASDLHHHGAAGGGAPFPFAMSGLLTPGSPAGSFPPSPTHPSTPLAAAGAAGGGTGGGGLPPWAPRTASRASGVDTPAGLHGEQFAATPGGVGGVGAVHRTASPGRGPPSRGGGAPSWALAPSAPLARSASTPTLQAMGAPPQLPPPVLTPVALLATTSSVDRPRHGFEQRATSRASTAAAAASAGNTGALGSTMGGGAGSSGGGRAPRRLRRIFVTGPARVCRQPLLRYVLPARSLPLARRGLDVVVVPGGHEPTAEQVGWVRGVLGLEAWQVVTTRGASYVMDEDMDEEVVCRLKQLVVCHPGDTWLLVPHDPAPPSFMAWAQPLAELGVLLLGEGPGGSYSSRALLYRSAAAPELPSLLEQLDADIKVPPGYICTTTDELLSAYGLLGGGEALVKPLCAVEGEGLLGVVEATPLALYSFQQGAVVLEKVLPLDRAPDGMVLSLAVPFQGSQVLSRGVLDEVVVGSSCVGFRASEAPRRLKQAAISTTQGLLMEMNMVGQGVFYWGSVNGEPVLTGYDATRLDGPLGPLFLVQQYGGPDTTFYTWRCKPPPGMGPAAFWQTLQAKGLAWDPTGGSTAPSAAAAAAGGGGGGGGGSPKGIFPLYYLKGLEVQLVAVGDTTLDCVLLQDKVRRVLERQIKGVSTGGKGAQPGGMSPRAPSTCLLGGSPRAGSAAEFLLGGLSPLAGGSAASLFGAFPTSRVRKGSVAMTLLVGAEAIYGPALLEERNLLLAGGKVVGVMDDAAAEALQLVVEGLRIQQCAGCIVTPGFIDCHVHITGGGGEAGPASRCPPSRLSAFLDGGLTTVVGLLGTDDISRSQDELIIRARALEQEGISAFTWIGSYHAPPATTTGNIRREMCLIESAVGVGELAVADHRGSQLRAAELARIAAEARVGGMLSGKAGLVHIHMGPGPSGLQLLREAVAGSDIPLTQFHPTHMDRSEELIAQGAAWLADGGSLDFTVRSIRARKALQQYQQANLPLGRVTVSSDAFGSLPSYDSAGRLVRYSVADAKSLLRFLRNMYFQERWPLERILPLMTSNPARLLQLRGKGAIKVGADADLLVLRQDNLQLQCVFAKGVLRRTPQWVQGGFFEKGSRIRPFAPTLAAEEEEEDAAAGGRGRGAAGKSCCW